jgi:site-specific DNA recombinase
MSGQRERAGQRHGPPTFVTAVRAATRPDEIAASCQAQVRTPQEGGTPFRAPLGYLNTREFVDGFSVSRVILDPERAPILRWCLDQYATGEWRVESGRHRVGHSGPREGAYHPTDAGQGNGADQHHDDVNLLHNPYYMGIIA